MTAWPPGNGEMAARVRAHDWEATPLGPSADWPLSLRSIIETMLQHGFPMVVLWGRDLFQVYNDGYRELMGMKHPAGLGQPTRDCWPEVWHINEPRKVWSGESVTFEDALYPITRSGRLEDAWFTLTYSALRDDVGAVAGVLVTVFETTRRILAERSLAESEERFRAFVTASSDAVYRMSPDWSEMRQLHGRGFLSDTGHPDRDWATSYIIPEDWPMVFRAIGAAIRDQRPFELEYRVNQADGSVGWTLSRAVPILSETGAILEWFGTASKITERKRVEEELHRSKERQAFLLRLSDTLRPLADPVEIQAVATRLIGEHIGASRVFYVNIESDGDTAVIHDNYVDGVPIRAGRYSLSAFSTAAVKEWRAGRTAASSDVDADPRYSEAERAAYAAVSTRAGYGVPLIKNDRLAAILGVNQSTPRNWTDQEMDLTREAAERTWAAVERARAEAALRANEARLAAVFEGVPVGITFVDAIGRMIISNAEAQHFLPSGRIPSLDPERGWRWHGIDSDGVRIPESEFPGA